jgi:hypothetical protein
MEGTQMGTQALAVCYDFSRTSSSQLSPISQIVFQVTKFQNDKKDSPKDFLNNPVVVVCSPTLGMLSIITATLYP